ncbi:MAG TPA: glycine cleavage system aminomethyltransferase GcvT [Rhizomicrobium sp.]|nr:glycine cleavage system aminomethyltransferase GcvT [Rhizomicrobium sp.]
MTEQTTDLKKTPLHALHVELGGKMVPFAGYEMPVQYPAGILKEHLHTREKAGLFDVSHMGQRLLIGPSHKVVAAALEDFTPGDFQALGVGRIRYTLLLNANGGIVDDLMVTRLPQDGKVGIVVNAARKDVDDNFIRARLPADVKYVLGDDRALLALQGPAAEAAMSRHCPDAKALSFMASAKTTFDGMEISVSRSGYTGEDGYEISVPAVNAEEIARALLAEPEVLPIGLGARDSLRLEAGLCLYGHDIDETTNPVEAGLTFAIGKRRKMEKNFPEAEKIMDELFNGAIRLRVGIRPDGRAPAREGTEIADKTGRIVGHVTSGGFGPTLNAPIAMGYVETKYAAEGTELDLMVRGKPNPARVVPMPFVPHRYKRGS